MGYPIHLKKIVLKKVLLGNKKQFEIAREDEFQFKMDLDLPQGLN